MKMETKKYICLEDYINHDDLLCFKEGAIYTFSKDGDWYRTENNHQGFSHEIDGSDINLYFKEIEHLETPKHYDNSKGSIYQFCENQNLNSYEFDILKRVIRCRKKGNFKEDLEKTKHLIDLYLKEYEVKN